jgi:predicted nucleic acid-binding protein
MTVRPERYDLDLTLDLERRVLEASVRITLANDTGETVEEISLLLNRLLRVERVAPSRGLLQAAVPMEGFEAQVVNHVVVRRPDPIPPGGRVTLDVAYAGPLGDYVDTGMLYVRDRIDPAFTILRPDAFAYPVIGPPSRPALRAAGLPEFAWSARIDVPATHVVACGGEATGRDVRGERAVHVHRSLRPSWRMDFAVAAYRTLRRGDLTVHHFPDDEPGAARVLAAMEDAFRLYAEWFGPLRETAPFTVIEIPDGWGSQADATCILQTAAAFADPARLVEVHHEVSHLWNVRALDHPSPRWNEGLAMFLQYEVADALDGTARRRRAVERAVERVLELARDDPAVRAIPMARYGVEGRTDLSYSVGMLMFDALHREVGPAVFREMVGGFYRAHAESGGATADFVSHADTVAGGTLGPFFERWLFTAAWFDELTPPA